MNLTKTQRLRASRLYGSLRDAGMPAVMPESKARGLAQSLGVPHDLLHKVKPEVGPNVRLIDICVLAAKEEK